ncbi:hypothetical protein BC829DRAFT_274643 [Chytridium lagenaria]|nr:hypothetical protein BC829DRAFT_274643 [Chytridium lagenaria]
MMGESEVQQGDDAGGINTLNSDELLLIFSWLPIKTLLRVSRVCRLWNFCSSDENSVLWRKVLVKTYPSLLSYAPHRFLGFSFRSIAIYKASGNEQRLWSGLSLPSAERMLVRPYHSRNPSVIASAPLGAAPYAYATFIHLHKDSVAWGYHDSRPYLCFGFISRLRVVGGLADAFNGDYVELEVFCTQIDHYVYNSTRWTFLSSIVPLVKSLL